MSALPDADVADMAEANEAQAHAADAGDVVTVAALVAYDGTRYAGFQRQAAERGPTVQGALEDAIRRLAPIGADGKPTTLVAAGRTDSGVHATGQVIGFQAPARGALGRDASVWPRALNALLPDDIAIRVARFVGPTFHARKSALERRYRYRILCDPAPSPLRERYVWRVAQRLDVDAMAAAAAALLGEHDFAAFGSSPWDRRADGYRGHTVRWLTLAQCAWLPLQTALPGASAPTHESGASGVSGVSDDAPDQPDEIAFDFAANAFLTGMVRRLVGTLALVGRDKLSADDVRGILAAREKAHPGAAAPARGLCLTHVTYPPEWGLW